MIQIGGATLPLSWLCLSGEAQRAGLWLYKQASRFGLFSVPGFQQIFDVAYFAYKRHFEDPFFNLSRRHPEFFKGGHIIDVGANTGYTAFVFGRALDEGFRVWAFEPASANFIRLQTTIANKGMLRQITPIRSAVGDRVGMIDLAINELHPADHQVNDDSSSGRESTPIEKVDLTTIDDAARSHGIRPVVFIKIDVQGYELNVCRGMQETLATNPRAAIAAEYSPESLRNFGIDPRELPGFFAARDYRAYRISHDGSLHHVDASNPPGHIAPPGYLDLLFVPA